MHNNLKIEKNKQYNPFTSRMIKRATVGRVKCYLRAVKQNPKDVHGDKKISGMVYNEKGYVLPRFYSGEIYDPSLVYYYEIGANDGSYRKETDKDKALTAFNQLLEFEKTPN